MTTVRRLDRKQLSAHELTLLLAQTRELAANLPPGERVQRLRLVADTMADHGRLAEAIELSEQIAKQVPASVATAPVGRLVRPGEAVGRGGGGVRAGRSPPTRHQAPAAAVQGWALTQQGKQADGRKLIDLAHLLPLANEAARHALADVLSRHGLTDDARRERELIARLGDPASWEVCDSVRRQADALAAKDPLAAAAMWDRAFLANLTTRTMFVDPSANLSIPVLIRRAKAVGKIRAGDAAGAVADAKACFAMMPGRRRRADRDHPRAGQGRQEGRGGGRLPPGVRPLRGRPPAVPAERAGQQPRRLAVRVRGPGPGPRADVRPQGGRAGAGERGHPRHAQRGAVRPRGARRGAGRERQVPGAGAAREAPRPEPGAVRAGEGGEAGGGGGRRTTDPR
jgi:hypothetical protein